MTEIEGLVQASNANMAKVSLLESQIGQLTVDLKKEQALKEGNEAELNDLVADLDRAETCVNELNQQLDSLKQESQTYKTKIDDLQSQIRQLEDDKASLEQTLDGERAGYESALDEKVTSIAVLERELAEKLNEFHTVNSKIEELSRQNTFEKKRADAAEATVQQIKQNVTSTVDMAEPPLEVYERKVRTLTQQNLLSQQLLNTKLSELASLKSRLDEVSDLSLFMPGEPSISDESSEIIAELKSEIEQLKVSSRQSQAQAKEKLILQNQTLAEQQDIINSLTKKVHDMDNSIADVSKQSLEKDTEGESAVNELRVKLENTTQEFSTWKAKANEKILTAENMLKSKEEQIQQLQVEIDAIITSQKDAAKTRTDADEESTMVKEKLRHKNQVIKDKDDVIEQLNKQLNDLQFEKDKVEQNLDMEVKRNEDFYHSHENQIQAMEDKLNKKHAAQVSELELEMQALKNKIVEIESAPPQIPLANNQEEQSARIKELQASLQQSKEKEVELINKNMMMKNQIDNSEAQKKLLVMSAADRNTRQENENAVELPSYYKEGKRARLRRVIGNVWRRIFRR
jgi:chromosome segregation ATPase